MHRSAPTPSSPLRLAHCAAALLACTLATYAPPAAAQTPQAAPAATPDPAPRVALGFHDAPLREVAQLYANLLGRGFVFPSEALASTRITLTRPEPVTLPEAYRALLAALDARGLTVVAQGDLLRIVRASSPAPPPPSAVVFDAPHSGLQTHFIPIHHAPLGPLRDTLAQVAAGSAQVLTDPRADRLIVIGPPAQAQRLRALVRHLDRPGSRAQVHIYTPQHQPPAALADALKAVTR